MNEQTPPRPQRPAPQLTHYPHRVTDTIRYADLDPQGHVNHAVFNTYFETGRVAMFRNKDLGIGVPGATFVLVRLETNYLRELRWPGHVDVGTGVAEFGRSSFKVAQAIFHDGHCAAMGLATMVCIDTTTRKPRPLPDEALAKLGQWKYQGA